jgi:predicted protein tyrosine phosphatase
MLKKITTFSRHMAEQNIGFITNCEGRVSFISILDSGSNPIFDQEYPHILTLQFDDVDPGQISSEYIAGHNLKAMDEVQARRIIIFLMDMRRNCGDWELYIQCSAGISRSGAVALFARDLFNMNIKRFRADNPHILPNPHVYNKLHETWATGKNLWPIGKTSLSVFNALNTDTGEWHWAS